MCMCMCVGGGREWVVCVWVVFQEYVCGLKLLLYEALLSWPNLQVCDVVCGSVSGDGRCRFF